MHIPVPMIPAALFAILAISRLGAVHTVVFGGFSPASLAQRIDSSRPRAIMTASCGIEGAKGPLSYKPYIDGALAKSEHRPERVIVWQRNETRWDPMTHQNGERNWQDLVEKARGRGVTAPCVPVASSDGIYIIYTSGTTGLPKGVLREAGGHAVGLNLSIRYLFNIHPGDVIFCASDIGWVVGHSYILYAPLLAGATTVLFEGKPVGTPDAGIFWRILREYCVNVLFTAPTALRAIRQEDPHATFFSEAGKHDGLKHLRALFLAGERSEPGIIHMYQDLLSRHCAPGAQVVDNWWSSESGSPISGIALHPAAGHDFNSPQPSHPSSALTPSRPGSAGKPTPGFDVRVVDDNGTEVTPNTMGNIVLSLPLAPTGFSTLFHDRERYYRGYLKRFSASSWMDTGDAGLIDPDGYIHIMSRSDDIINVAAHRFSTGAIEQAIASHPDIAECCVVGVPDALKGQLPFAFVTLSTDPSSTTHAPIPSAAAAVSTTAPLMHEIQTRIREQIGPIAALGGLLQGSGMIPKTRSGKTLRRVLRDLLENAARGQYDAAVSVPATVEDAAVVEVARGRIREYFVLGGGAARHRSVHGRDEGPKRAKL